MKKPLLYTPRAIIRIHLIPRPDAPTLYIYARRATLYIHGAITRPTATLPTYLQKVAGSRSDIYNLIIPSTCLCPPREIPRARAYINTMRAGRRSFRQRGPSEENKRKRRKRERERRRCTCTTARRRRRW